MFTPLNSQTETNLAIEACNQAKIFCSIVLFLRDFGPLIGFNFDVISLRLLLVPPLFLKNSRTILKLPCIRLVSCPSNILDRATALYLWIKKFQTYNIVTLHKTLTAVFFYFRDPAIAYPVQIRIHK